MEDHPMQASEFLSQIDILWPRSSLGHFDHRCHHVHNKNSYPAVAKSPQTVGMNANPGRAGGNGRSVMSYQRSTVCKRLLQSRTLYVWRYARYDTSVVDPSKLKGLHRDCALIGSYINASSAAGEPFPDLPVLPVLPVSPRPNEGFSAL